MFSLLASRMVASQLYARLVAFTVSTTTLVHTSFSFYEEMTSVIAHASQPQRQYGCSYSIATNRKPIRCGHYMGPSYITYLAQPQKERLLQVVQRSLSASRGAARVVPHAAEELGRDVTPFGARGLKIQANYQLSGGSFKGPFKGIFRDSIRV